MTVDDSSMVNAGDKDKVALHKLEQPKGSKEEKIPQLIAAAITNMGNILKLLPFEVDDQKKLFRAAVDPVFELAKILEVDMEKVGSVIDDLKALAKEVEIEDALRNMPEGKEN